MYPNMVFGKIVTTLSQSVSDLDAYKNPSRTVDVTPFVTVAAVLQVLKLMTLCIRKGKFFRLWELCYQKMYADL
jgi:hypothetical protein